VSEAANLLPSTLGENVEGPLMLGADTSRALDRPHASSRTPSQSCAQRPRRMADGAKLTIETGNAVLDDNLPA